MISPARRQLKVLIFLFLLPGCSPRQADQLIGGWQLVGQETVMSIEFRRDGTYYAQTGRGQVRGKWSLVGQNHIATWSDDRRAKRVNAFRFENGELLITDDDGAIHRHARVP